MSINGLKKRAFTMAEAILVMTILGIIATIMITTLKPSQFKDKGLKILARKSIEQIDVAINQMLTNNSRDNTLEELYKLGTDDTFSAFNYPETAKLIMQKYLRYKRDAKLADCSAQTRTELARNTIADDENEQSFGNVILRIVARIGKGTCNLLIDDTFFVYADPSANSSKISIMPDDISVCSVSSAKGYIFIDVNGVYEEPNLLGKDRFILPLNERGIWWDAPCD